MALYREPPKCENCQTPMQGKYRDQSYLPPMLQVYGDTFMGWEYACDCTHEERQRAISDKLNINTDDIEGLMSQIN